MMRNGLAKLLVVGKIECCLVTNIDPTGHFIDLSKKAVEFSAMQSALRRYTARKSIYSVMYSVTQRMNYIATYGVDSFEGEDNGVEADALNLMNDKRGLVPFKNKREYKVRMLRATHGNLEMRRGTHGQSDAYANRLGALIHEARSKQPWLSSAKAAKKARSMRKQRLSYAELLK